jgi:hypothetical protein
MFVTEGFLFSVGFLQAGGLDRRRYYQQVCCCFVLSGGIS